jgi:DNA-binding NarL/FixJ family response regulator
MKKAAVKNYTILVIDPLQVIREGIRSYISDFPANLQVLEAENYNKGNDLALKHKPDAIIMECCVKGEDPTKFIDGVKKVNPDIKLLIFSNIYDKKCIKAAVNNKVKGFICKSVPKEEFVLALKNILNNSQYFCSKIAQEFLTDLKENPSLTSRETQILKMIAGGFTNKEIADKLNISPKTVNNHRQNILTKLKAKNSAELGRIALEKNLL